ncbi:Dihydroorotase [Gammaproteobacteria bacterium]
MQTLLLTRPDDWHLHLRDGLQLSAILPDTVAHFARALIMPNLKPPLTTVASVLAYRSRILAALPKGADFTPLMTLYLTENTSPAEIILAKQSGVIHGIKFYPAGATTHSEAGVQDITRVWPILETMEKLDLPLLVHGEVSSPEVDPFDREQVFLDRYLAPLVEKFSNLRVVLEHITTSEAVEFVRHSSQKVAATITPHHMFLNRSALFQGGLRPHYYCLPVLKREKHRRAILDAAISGNPKFFLGTDSAPHSRFSKESGCACAGIYNAPVALELCTEIFSNANALNRLEGFTSFYGTDFYELRRNQGILSLEESPWTVPKEVSFGADHLVPFCAGESMQWRVKN